MKKKQTLYALLGALSMGIVMAAGLYIIKLLLGDHLLPDWIDIV